MNTSTIDGFQFANMIRGGAASLSEHRKLVNDLNVFPIPDGDTGDNMYMTISSGVEAIDHGASDALGDTAKTVARGMLLGARGNSGVILSRIFAGISQGLEGVERANVQALARALQSGVTAAYGAVSVPVEGTILTVYKDAVRYACDRIDETSSFESYFDDFLAELRRSLERTPELLDVLKQAGVVDSGGAGIIYIAEGMKQALEGDTFDRPAAGSAAAKVDLDAFTEDSVLEFGYCTEFLLRLQREKVDLEHCDLEEIESYLNCVGSSVVCFREGSIVKVHVHTKTPGQILNHCQSWGEFLTLKIENMNLQHNALAVHAPESAAGSYVPAATRPKKPYGIVAVASGEGLQQIFRELGCDVVVDGGQSMNPSAQDFLDAFDAIDSRTILVYPNNSNILLTAQQAAKLYDRADVRIVPSRSIGEGYAGISQLNTASGDTEAILAEQQAAISGVVTGLVSTAIRDTKGQGVQVHAGDYIGFVNECIYAADPVRERAALQLCKAVGTGNYDVLLLLGGGAVPEDEAEALRQKLEQANPLTEVIRLSGGQPIFDYIMIFE